MDSLELVPTIVKDLFKLVDQLETRFPGRKFTPDGHLIGSIGEVISAYRYGLELLPHSAKGHDARTAAGTLVEIKVTQGKSVALREEPVHLLVLHLSRSGEATEVYNGPGTPVWAAAGKMQKNGQRPISLVKLRALMSAVSDAERIPQIRS